MNLHEYQAKELLKRFNVPVQEGIAVDNVMAAEEAYRQIKNDTRNNFAVVKAQIHGVVAAREKYKVRNNVAWQLVKASKMFRILQETF